MAAAGGLMLVGAAGAAFAAEVRDSDVDVSVQIAPVVGPGSLSLTAADTSATLTASASGDADVRQFSAALPDVTVTDTRDVADILADHFWCAVGQVWAFTGQGAAISLDHFGWTARLVDGGDTGLIAEGEAVGTSENTGDDAIGLVDQELVHTALESAAVEEGGESSWTAGAVLVLKTDAGCVRVEAEFVAFEDVITRRQESGGVGLHERGSRPD